MLLADQRFHSWNCYHSGLSQMVVTTATLFTFLLETATGSHDSRTETPVRVTPEPETEHSYVQDAQAGLSHMLDELKAFQKRIEDSVLHAEKGAFWFAGILCSIAMLVLVAGALYNHFHGNYVPKYVRVVRKNGKETLHDHHATGTNGRLKSE